MKTKSKKIQGTILDLKPNKDAKGGNRKAGGGLEYGARAQTLKGGATHPQILGSDFQHNETLVRDEGR